MGLFRSSGGRESAPNPGTGAGAMVPFERQSDPLAGRFLELAGVSGLAPAVCGRIDPQRLYELVVGCAPFLADSTLRPTDHLAQASTPTFEVAWSVFTNGDVSLAMCILIRHEGDYALQILRLLIEPLAQMASANGLHSSVASRGKGDIAVVDSMRGAHAVHIDQLAGTADAGATTPARRLEHMESVPDLSRPGAGPFDGAPAASVVTASASPPPPVEPVRSAPVTTGPGALTLTSRMPPVVPAVENPRPMPTGRVLVKGENMVLTTDSGDPGSILVDLEWTLAAAGSGRLELDASAIAVGADDRVLSDQHLVFFNNAQTPDGSVAVHRPTEPIGSNEFGSSFRVNLTDVPPAVAKVVFAVAIYDAAARGHSYADVERAHIGVRVCENVTEIGRFPMNRPGNTESAMIFGEVYKHGGRWKFRAIGQGYASGLAGIAADYGVVVD